MASRIIIKPQLQTNQQKISAFCIAALSGALWLYFLLPLLTLGCWLLGCQNLSAEIRWFGGYKTLLELLQIYGLSIVGIVACWFCWALFTSWWKPTILPAHQVAVDDATLCATFRITQDQLLQSRLAKVMTVSFDGAGDITGIAIVEQKTDVMPGKRVDGGKPYTLAKRNLS